MGGPGLCFCSVFAVAKAGWLHHSTSPTLPAPLRHTHTHTQAVLCPNSLPLFSMSVTVEPRLKAEVSQCTHFTMPPPPCSLQAGLLLDGKQLKGRPLRVTRLKRSGQQAAGGGSSFGGGGKGAQQRGGGGGKGGEQGGKAGSKATAASWQGTMTKGRGKLGGSRGGSSPSKSLSKAKGGGQGGAGKLKGKQRAAGGPLGVRPVAGKRKASGKRPAVAAKKQRQLAAKGSKKAK